jgi:gas vesicle protein
MRKLLSMLLGLLIGVSLGAALVLLFAPTSGDQLLARVRHGWEETLAEAQRASAERRAELEAELARKQRRE